MIRSYEHSPWTDEDRALMLALDLYRSTLCPGCDQPKETAWHPDQDGWWEADPAATFVCHPCTVRAKYHNPDHEPVEYVGVIDTRPYEEKPLPPWPAPRRLRAPVAS